MADGSYFLTTPIYYVNAAPHVGHAYTTIMADIIARHRRQRGDEVFFLTGTDEHGSKIARSAEEAGRTPREHADILSRRFRDMGELLGASADFFIRTTDPEHAAEVGRVWSEIKDHGDVYRDTYGGWYCVACETFYAEGDLGPGQTCPIHGTPVEWLEEDNWFFRLSAYRDRLLALYAADPGWVQPAARFNEARRMIEDGLADLSISRSQIDWGIPVPWDPEQVIYVWIDALLNYRSALTYADGDDLTRLWPPDLHLMAKDILKFHAVIWPAMLMAAGLELPRRLFVHGYVLKGGERMSKTTGNVVDPFPFIEEFGLDALRYYLAREIRFGEDGTFTHEGFVGRYNNELANDLGNLLNRTVNMIGRYREGVVPAVEPGAELAATAGAHVQSVRSAFDALEITRAVEEIWALVRRLNQFVEETAPWTLAKDPARGAELDRALGALAEGLRIVALLVWPVIPGSAEAILAALGQPADAVDLAGAGWGAGIAGASVAARPPLFPRVEVAE